MDAERKDPYQSFRFRVEIDGLIVGGFSEVTGVQKETQIEEYREGGVNDFVHRLPRETKFPNLVLKRGLTASDGLWKWHSDVQAGKIEKKTVHIIITDSLGSDAWRWSFEKAFPVKWSGADLKADANAVAVESIELAHVGFRAM